MFFLRSVLFRGIVCAAFLSIPAMASAGIATIGPTADCDYVVTGANNAIAQALADGRRDLRVVAGTRNAGSAGGTLSSASAALSIRGGYADCVAAAAGATPGAAARSIWQSSEGQALMAVLSFGPDRGTFVLSGFTLEPAPDAVAFAPNGGALVVGGPVDATLENMEVSGFRAVDRGGALMLSTHAEVRLLNTRIEQSRAARGGGIACENAHVLIDADSRLFNNYAGPGGLPGQDDNGFGGGAYLRGCSLLSEARVDAGGSPLSGGMSYNYAFGSGGGIAARDSSVLLLGGEACHLTPAERCRQTLATMVGNSAGASGGAVHADNSVVGFVLANVSANTATHHGGGLAGVNDTRFILDGSAEGGARSFCLLSGGCARMRHNRSGSPPAYPGAGGAISLDASLANIYEAVLEENLSGVGSAFALANDSYVSVFQSALSQRAVLPGQSFHSMIFVGWNSAMSMSQSTAILDGVAAPDAPGMLVLGDGAGFFPGSNVLFSRGAPLLAAQPTASIQSAWCNAVSDAARVAALDAVHIGATDFENAARPLRPARTGAMVDICESEYFPGETDLEGGRRVVLAIPGREATPQDAGAFEVQNDDLFSDGFEPTGPVVLY